ncbi:MAG: YvcK family protein [Acidobacteria bacterium]|nr:YvcK family protein [Acidobacteriota bacterium]
MRRSRLRVVLFSGGRGSGALTAQLVSNPRIDLTVAINGYDDGASTGEVRRFLGDALGPSDFRKNASRLARVLKTAPDPLIDLLDLRLPADLHQRSTGDAVADAVSTAIGPPELQSVTGLAAALTETARTSVAQRLARFARELQEVARPFAFADSSVGNLVFAGAFLQSGRCFNDAVDDYCALLGLPRGIIENVTDGADAHLVAIDADGRLLGSEEEIVDAKRRNRIDDIYLLDGRPGREDADSLRAAGRDELARRLSARTARIGINPRLASAVAQADLIVYAPGTQHSSLFPSYLTPGLSQAIAANLKAIKLLVTNIQTDAEITGSSAVDIIERAVFYLKEKGRLSIPTPCLITHYLVNDPQNAESATPYVPLGRLESLEDPRLIRVGNYEEGVTGRHDATKILGPFVDAYVDRWSAVQRVAVYLHDAGSTTKIVQSILEMVRGGIGDLPVEIAVFHDGPAALEASFVASLGFPVTRLEGPVEQQDQQLRSVLHAGPFDYVIMFESSGMYNGEDIANLASHLSLGRLDAVWGSRRLSVKDIHESYRLKYRHRSVLGAISYVGSHSLSLLYLAMYGRYVSDTLSAARAVRTSDVLRVPCRLTDKLVNQHLLSVLLRRKAEMFEVPVQFFSIAPDQVRRTTPFDGLRAVGTVLRGRVP